MKSKELECREKENELISNRLFELKKWRGFHPYEKKLKTNFLAINPNTEESFLKGRGKLKIRYSIVEHKKLLIEFAQRLENFYR